MSTPTEITAPVLDGVDMLGRGYNVLGAYASADECLASILAIPPAQQTVQWPGTGSDAAATQFLVPAGTTVTSTSGGFKGNETSGSSYYEYAKNMRVALGAEGSSGMFSGSIDASYSSEVRSSSSHYYETVMDTFNACKLALPDSQWQLDPNAAADLQGESALEPRDFFAKYGTHVVVGAIIGGQCRMSMYASSESFSSLQEFQVAAKATYGAASGSSNVSGSTSTKSSSSIQSSEMEVLGGTEEAQSNLWTSWTGSYDSTAEQSAARSTAHAAWAASIKQNPAVVGFASTHLVPVWDKRICSDPDRRAQLESEYNRLYVPVRRRTWWDDSGSVGNTNLRGGTAADLFVDDDPNDWFVVGLGLTNNTNGNLARAAVAFENVRTGTRVWGIDSGDGKFVRSTTIPTNYEHLTQVPGGCAVVGLAVHAIEDNVKGLRLYYQRINQGEDDHVDGGALDTYIDTEEVGKGGWDYDGKPASALNSVLGGLKLGIKDNDKVWVRYERSEFYAARTRSLTLACGAASKKDYGSVSKVNLRGMAVTSIPDLDAATAQRLVVVGFAGTVNDSGNLAHAAVCFGDVETGEQTWFNESGARITDTSGYELGGTVPPRCALTGLGVHAENDKLKHMVLYYQQIKSTDDLATVGDCGLEPTIGETYLGAKQNSWDGVHKPARGNVNALSGLFVGIYHNNTVGFRFDETPLTAIAD